MLLQVELTQAIIEKVFGELQSRNDSDDIEKVEVEKWAANFVENNNPSDIQPDVIDTADFFEWYDN